MGYVVQEIDSTLANEVVKRYHYSGKAVPNSQLHLGVYDEIMGGIQVLVGCLSFGPPINGDKTTSKLSDNPRVYELNRMVMKNSEPRNSESKAIAKCVKWLRANTDIDWLLSFSDGKEGNVGYIYQASNWKYLGYFLSNSFYELDDKLLHSITIWHRYKENHPDRDTKTTNEILCDNFDNVSVIECKQHVYVMQIRNHAPVFKFPEQPYPKKDKEVPIIRRKWIKKEGVIDTSIETYTDEIITSIF